MECKHCGSTDIHYQGFAIIGEDRDADWAKDFLYDEMFTCRDCHATFIVKGGEENDKESKDLQERRYRDNH